MGVVRETIGLQAFYKLPKPVRVEDLALEGRVTGVVRELDGVDEIDLAREVQCDLDTSCEVD